MSKTLFLSTVSAAALLVCAAVSEIVAQTSSPKADDRSDAQVQQFASEGKKIFRFDTFGDQTFWGDTLKLHQAIQGEKFGGVGPGVSPKKALELGLKVDMDAVPPVVAAGI